MKTHFDHEKLDVYQESIVFCSWVGDLLNEITSKAAAKDQLDRASTSLPLNIAEGNGKFSDADRSRFLEIARGSALECAACLDVLARRFIAAERIVPAKEQLVRIVKMLMGMLKRFRGARSFCVRTKEHILGSTIMSRSRSTITSRSTINNVETLVT
jgi:four helix bundle protein